MTKKTDKKKQKERNNSLQGIGHQGIKDSDSQRRGEKGGKLYACVKRVAKLWCREKETDKAQKTLSIEEMELRMQEYHSSQS